MEPNNTNTTQPEQVVEPVVQAASTPSMFQLLKGGWQFVKTRRDLVMWYIITLSILPILTSPYVMYSSDIGAFGAGIGALVLGVFIAINAWAIIYAVSQSDQAAVTYRQAFSWASSNFFPLLWTSILSGLAVLVGFIALIIPGIIISFYLYFALYAQAQGSGVGTKAIKASYQTVKGRFGSVAWKLIVLGFYIMVINIIAGILYGIFAALFIDEGVSMVLVEAVQPGLFETLPTLIADVLMQGILGGIVGAAGMYAIAGYFKYLQSTKPASEVTQ